MHITVCPTCGAKNKIVNQCRCDPNNLPTTVSTDEGDNILTVGELADRINRLPRAMKVWVGVPKEGGGFEPCLVIRSINAEPGGTPGLDDCGIILNPKVPYSNLS